MNVMQQALIQACDNLSIPYEILHKDKILVRVEINGRRYHYIHWFLPFNRFDVQRILRDKDLQYTLLNEVITIPRWKAYFSYVQDDKEHAKFVGFTLEQIKEDILRSFDFPLLIKPNKGSKGSNVRVCQAMDEAVAAIQDIFSQPVSRFSNIVLVQQYISIKNEYRVVAYAGKAVLVYKKDIAHAQFAGNISPLHWEGSKAIHITDTQQIQKLEEFIKPVFSEIDMVYGGFDVAEDPEGNLWLIEINGRPQVSIFVRDNGLAPVVKMHEEILTELVQG